MLDPLAISGVGCRSIGSVALNQIHYSTLVVNKINSAHAVCAVLGLVFLKRVVKDKEAKGQRPGEMLLFFSHTRAGTGDTDVFKVSNNRAALSKFVYVCARETELLRV